MLKNNTIIQPTISSISTNSTNLLQNTTIENSGFKTEDKLRVNHVLAMLSLNKTKNFITNNSILEHLVAITFELPISFINLIKSELFIQNLIRNEVLDDLTLKVFCVTDEPIEKTVEQITHTLENGSILIIFIVNINFNDLILDVDFKESLLGVWKEGEQITNPSYLKTLYIFENYTWVKLVDRFREYKIGISAGVTTRRHLISRLEHKFNTYLISMGINLSSIVKHFNNIVNKTDSNKRSFYNSDVDKDNREANHLKNKIGFYRDNSVINFPRVQYIGNNIHHNRNVTINNLTSSPSNKREFTTSSINCIAKSNSILASKKTIDNKKLIKGERVTKINKAPIKEVSNNQPKINLSILDYLNISTNISKNDLTYLDVLETYITENNNITEQDLVEIQTKMEQQFLEIIKEKMNDPNFMKHRLVTCVNKAFESLKVFLSNKRKYKTYFPELKDYFYDKDLLLLTFGIITTYITNYSATNLTSRVGTEVLWLIFLKLKKSENKLIIKKNNTIKSFEEFKKDINWDENLRIQLGFIFISRFEEIEIILTEFRLNDRGEYQNFYIINPNYIELIINNMFILPPSLPMVCEPSKWDDKNYGGFLINKEEQQDLITGSINNNSHKMVNKKKIFKAINYLNSTKFNINIELLEYILNEGKYLLEYENKNLDEDKDFSGKLQLIWTLKLAQIYKNITFYLNTSADWRGRIYTKSFFLSYQGNDLTNALIQFEKGESLTPKGIDYLYIIGANAYDENGISKKTYQARKQWVLDNYDNIIAMEPEFILKADSKYIFIAFCLNIRKLNKDIKAKIYTPVFLDATCSGIQHLAALIKDFELGSRVNLIKQNDDDLVGDIYTFILDPINKALNRIGKTNEEYKHFTKINLTRSLIKWNIMTIVYNITYFGGSRQLESRLDKITKESEEYKEFINNFGENIPQTLESITSKLEDQLEKKELIIQKKGKNTLKEIYYKAPADNKLGYILLTKKDLFEIARVIHDQVFISFPSLKEVYEYLVNITKILTKLNIPVTWFTPAGMILTQHYNKSEVERCSFRMGANIRTIVLKKKDRTKMHTAKQVQAIIPNIIHSLDASHLINIINTADSNNFKPIITVHDCFGTHPNKMEELSYLVKKEFISLYLTENFLKKFHKKILESITDNNIEIFKDKGTNKISKNYVLIKGTKYNIPDLPAQGNLKLHDIIESKYIIT